MKQRAPGVYFASNVTFDARTTTAYSYGWWCFVRIIDGQVVFNRYPYSPTTCRHQSKVQYLMDSLGIKVDKWVLSLDSLSSTLPELCFDSLEALQEYQRKQRNARAKAKRAAKRA
jgi:hypothetical protein